MPKPKPRERQLIIDYIRDRFPNDRVGFDFPLGPPPTRLIAEFGYSKALRIGRASRVKVDAVIWKDGTLILVEAKIREWVNGVAKLPLYKALVPETPELEPYWEWPVRMVLALPYSNELIESACERLGVELDEFTSATVDEAMAEVQKWQSPEWRKAQAEKRHTREILGLE